MNERLCRYVSRKIWDSREAAHVDFYQKVEFANPTPLMQSQTLLDIMYELQTSLQTNQEDESQDIKYAWTIEGRPINSIMDLHQKCRIVLVSNRPHFKGMLINNQPDQTTVDEVKPKPTAWVNQASKKWSAHN